jgi:hypothetical protein
MANLNKMASVATQNRPLVNAVVVPGKDYIEIRIPRTVACDSIREKTDEKGTRFGMTCVPTNEKGLASSDVEINVTEGDKTSVAKFGLGVFNLSFHGFKA